MPGKITDLSAVTTLTPTVDLLEVVTGSDNLKIATDDFALLSQPDIITRVYKDSNTAIVTATITAIPFNQEEEDDYAFHNPAVNPSRLTVPAGYDGLYIAVFHFRWAAHITGRRLGYLRLNGATNLGRSDWTPATGTHTSGMSAVAIYPLVATDYVEGCVFHNRGANLNVDYVAAWSPYLSLLRIGRSP